MNNNHQIITQYNDFISTLTRCYNVDMLSTILLSDLLLSDIMPTIDMLSVIVLNVDMLNVIFHVSHCDVFVLGKHFDQRLHFAGKAGAYLRRPYSSKSQDNFSNISLDQNTCN
jgi:hypothetical protein